MEESNRDKLKEQLAYLGFDRFWIESFFIQFNLPEREQDIQVILQNIQPGEGLSVDLKFEKERGDNEYRLKEYYAQLSLAPEIRHATIGSVDTQLLDNLMAQLDWRFDYRILEENYSSLSDIDRASFEKYVQAVYNVILLAATDEGKLIADALKIKHFTGTPYERFLNLEIRDKYIRTATFYCAAERPVTFAEASNILNGRSVRKIMNRPAGGQTALWVKLGTDIMRTVEIPFFTNKEERFEDYDLLSELRKLPLKEKNGDSLLLLDLSMQKGDLVSIRLVIKGETRHHFIEAAPEAKGYNLYNHQMQKVNITDLQLTDYGKTKRQPEQKGKGKRL